MQGTVVRSVHDALEETGLDPQLLQLELSERGALRDDPEILHQLNELNDMGVSLAIDDFGIGQTALSYLATLPVQVIKIDRFFVESLLKDEASASITGAIIAISRQLGLTVVAEGVEEEAQLRFLQDNHCDEVQGNLLSLPLQRQEATNLLANPRRIRRLVTDYNISDLGVSAINNVETRTISGVLNEFPHADDYEADDYNDSVAASS